MNKRLLFLYFIIIACHQPVPKPESQFSKDIKSYLSNKDYNVEIIDETDSHQPVMRGTGKLIVNQDNGLITFKGTRNLEDFNHFQINLHDSTFMRFFFMNHYLDTVNMIAPNTEIKEDCFGYAFGFNNTVGISDIPEFRQFFSKENISGQQYLYIIAQTAMTHRTIIRQVERVAEEGKIITDINRTFILTPTVFR